MKTQLFAAALLLPALVYGQRSSQEIRNWQFSRDSVEWNKVTIPHDWAIYGPFDRENDIQKVAVEQNGETVPTWKTGRSGGLPFIGKGYYSTTINVPDTAGRSLTLLFDGAMSRPRVYVNGKYAGGWAYGYNSFEVPLDGFAVPGENKIEVSLENLPGSSRWYPGAGLYRNVHLIDRPAMHIPVWGTCITTPRVSDEVAQVNIVTKVEGSKGARIQLTTRIYGPEGELVATDKHPFTVYPGEELKQNFIVNNPKLWSPETPSLYSAVTEVSEEGSDTVIDSYTTRFGIRSIELGPGEGFFLNGKKRKFKGVCNHHDLGPLGAAVNKEAIRHQLEMLRDMGADAIRTSHNMPAPELVELCDEMGFMMMVEPFDEWGQRPKCENGYATLFDEWAERDMVNMIRHYRNNPSVVMWSIGNEVPSQSSPDGIAELVFLQDIAHREDPTRPVTCGMDRFNDVVYNGFAAALDIPGFNYKVDRYERAIPRLPQNLLLGTETASTVSSRGKYYFPIQWGKHIMRDDLHSNSYDTEYCYWSNIPDDDFVADDDLDYNIGQFVWTGFDYLGEPTPYDTDTWPSHSSYFGIIDLASIPKDRYYLYRSKWNTTEPTLHILPHWNWEGREGEITPVFVYTDSPKAELFINGKSQGMREKNDSTHATRYRLMWNESRYEPGEVTAVSYDAEGRETGRKTIRTAGKPHHLVLTPNRTSLRADGDDLAYVTVQVADKAGNIVPTDSREVRFKVKGAGKFRATANGDPTSVRLFHKPEMDLFSGAATVILQAAETPGIMQLEVSAPGVKSAKLNFDVKN